MKNLLLIIVFVAVSGNVFAFSDPDHDWKVLESKHFEVIYDASSEDGFKLADDVLQTAENAHVFITRLFGWKPSGKTKVMIADYMDGHNGLATLIPEKTIYIYPHPPNSFSQLAEYDYWIKETVIHEYAHILNMDTVHGLFKFLRYIFGSVSAPNGALPPAMLEGFSILMESHLTPAGRGRGTYFNMILRQAQAEGKLRSGDFIELDEACVFPTKFPAGAVPYLMGYKFVEFLFIRYGPDIITKFNVRNSYHIPYSINRVFRKILGKSMKELWDEMIDSLVREYKGELERIQQSPVSPVTKITDTGFYTYNPVPGKDHVYYIQNLLGREDTGLYKTDLKTGESSMVTGLKMTGRISLSPDGNQLAYGKKADFKDKYGYSYRDLYVYDMKEEKSTRLTTGARASSASFVDDNHVVFIKRNSSLSNQIVKVNTKTKNAEVIVEFPKTYRAEYPSYSPSGKKLIFSLKVPGMGEQVYIYYVDQEKYEPITPSDRNSIHPVWTSENEIYFISDRTGVFNLYRYDFTKKKSTRISNVTGGVFHPFVSGDKVYVSSYSSKGFNVAFLKLSDAKEFDQNPYIRKAHIIRLPMKKLPRIRYSYTRRDYSPWHSLIPKYWMPSIYVVPDGVQVGALSQGWDTTATHFYTLSALYDTRARIPSGAFAFLTKAVYPNIGGMVAGINEYLSWQKTTRHSFVHRFFLSDTLKLFDEKFIWRVGYFLKYSSYLYGEGGISSGVFQYASYANTKKKPEGITSYKGRRVQALFAQFPKFFGSRHSFLSFVGVYDEFLKIPWLDHHVFHFRFAAAITHFAPLWYNYFQAGGEINMQMGKNTFLARGYLSGQIIAKRLYSMNFEYYLPLWIINRGSRTTPIFFRSLYFALIFDAVTRDETFKEMIGGQHKEFQKFYTSVGGELILKTTTGYYMPFIIRVGFYQTLLKNYKERQFFVGFTAGL